MYDRNPGEIDFGSSQRKIRVSEGSSYRELTVHKEMGTMVHTSFFNFLSRTFSGLNNKIQGVHFLRHSHYCVTNITHFAQSCQQINTCKCVLTSLYPRITDNYFKIQQISRFKLLQAIFSSWFCLLRRRAEEYTWETPLKVRLLLYLK